MGSEKICISLTRRIEKQHFFHFFGTVSKTTRELLLEWNKENPVDLSSDLKMPQFTVKKVVTGHCEESSLIGMYAFGHEKLSLE